MEHSKLTLAATGLGVVALTYSSIRAIYLAFFHPLAKVPGPKHYAVTDIFFLYHSLKGDWIATLEKLHEQYGSAVRFSPEDVSFIDPEAWKTIYGHKTNSAKNFDKDLRMFSTTTTGAPNILISNNDDHRRMRRILAHAFSEKALRGQEDILKGYIDLFMDKIAENANKKEPFDIVMWYNFTTFDIIGDLAFGRPFGCLEKGEYNPWIANIFNSIRLGPYTQAIKRYPFLLGFKNLVSPASSRKAYDEHSKLSTETALARVEAGETGRDDFMTYILRHNDEKGLTQNELVENARVMITAGSETTATLLSGTTFQLLTNRDKYMKLCAEIRSNFKSEDEITSQTVSTMPYLLAVFNEGFRMYPPVPTGMARLVPQGGEKVNGYYMPENTSVSVSHWSAYQSEQNWYRPKSFLPERWIELEDPRFVNDKRDVLQPFSFGPRNCIGKNLAYVEMRLILTRLLFKFDLELMLESKNWNQQKVFLLWNKGGLYVKLTPAGKA